MSIDLDAIEAALEVARERGEATADLRAGIEARLDEWRAATDDRCGCATCTTTRRHIAALDALLREGK